MIVYMVLLLLVILLVSVLNNNVEGFMLDEYPALAEGIKPPEGSCINLLVGKGWVDLDDDSPGAKERRSIIADMEVARVAQNMFSNTIHPNIHSCAFGKDVIDLYYNAKGSNIIDPETCEMRGVTIDGELIYHQLEKIDSSSPIHPKGCMIDLERTDQRSFEKLTEDAYKLKMYPELKEKNEYKQAVISLSQNNLALKEQFKKYRIKDSFGKASDISDYESERIANAECRDDYTPWNSAGDWTFNFLDRHSVKCRDGEVLGKFQLETLSSPNRTRYKYRCCKVDTEPIPKKIREEVKSSSTAFNDSLQWNTIALTSQPVECASGERRDMLRGFNLESQYIDSVTSKAKYNFDCVSHKPYGLVNKQIKTKCRKVTTPVKDNSTTFNALDKHHVECKDGEGISDFVLRTDGAGLYYEYTCCRPEIVADQ